jgi:hypothetical protein
MACLCTLIFPGPTVVCQCILVYGSVENHQSLWIYDYDYDYDYDQIFWSYVQLQYILQLCMAPEYLMVFN